MICCYLSVFVTSDIRALRNSWVPCPPSLSEHVENLCSPLIRPPVLSSTRSLRPYLPPLALKCRAPPPTAPEGGSYSCYCDKMPDKSNLRKDLFRLTDNAPKEAIRHKGESSKELTEGMFNTALGLFRICMFGVRMMAGIKRVQW